MDDTILDFRVFEDALLPQSNAAETAIFYRMEENPDETNNYTEEIYIPDISDDGDDFSWLFKILPTENRIVPENEVFLNKESQNLEENACVTSKQSIMAKEKENCELTKFELSDPRVSEIDVTLSVKPAEIVNQPSPSKTKSAQKSLKTQKRRLSTQIRDTEQRQMRRSITQTPKNYIDNTPGTVQETPSLRRSLRKRSYHDMVKSETNSYPSTPAPARKRNRCEEPPSTGNRGRQKSFKTLPITSADYSDKPKTTHGDLKVIFRKHKIVNPLDQMVFNGAAYRRGLMDARKHLSAELYYCHTILPRAAPGFENPLSVTNPLNFKDNKNIMILENMKNHNLKANMKAHGNSVLNITPSGKAKACFALVDFDNKDQYETLLSAQHSILESSQQRQISEMDTSANLNATFMNIFSFNDYFDDNSTDDCVKKKGKMLNDRITGAVGVKSKKSLTNSFLSNHIVFQYKGKLYRPNPVTIPILRISDDEVQEFKAKPRKATLKSPYYAAMTSYFDSRRKLANP